MSRQVSRELVRSLARAESPGKLFAALVSGVAAERPASLHSAVWLRQESSPELRLVSDAGALGADELALPLVVEDGDGDGDAKGAFVGAVIHDVFVKARAQAASGSTWRSRPAWTRRTGVEAYVAAPILRGQDVFGVVASFLKAPLGSEDLAEEGDWLSAVAELCGSLLSAVSGVSGARGRPSSEPVIESSSIVGTSEALRDALEQAEMVAPTQASVLILGESGTGKELIARHVHENSDRRHQPLVRVNCAAIPRELFESEFFGHVRGSFTGAVRDRVGRFQAADGGTLFLDEVSEIPFEQQSKLLRVLQEGTFERVGEERSRSVDVRIVAATNRDLRVEAAEGRFREDLYYRLAVFPVELPPLRARPEDVPLLASHFLSRAVKRHRAGARVRFGDRDLERLMRHHWPGNVRELENVVERAVIVARDGIARVRLDFEEGPLPEPSPADSGAEAILSYDELRDLEKANVERALESTGWQIAGAGGAAELLGLKPTTLRSKMEALGIDRSPFRSPQRST